MRGTRPDMTAGVNRGLPCVSVSSCDEREIACEGYASDAPRDARRERHCARKDPYLTHPSHSSCLYRPSIFARSRSWRLRGERRARECVKKLRRTKNNDASEISLFRRPGNDRRPSARAGTNLDVSCARAVRSVLASLLRAVRESICDDERASGSAECGTDARLRLYFRSA